MKKSMIVLTLASALLAVGSIDSVAYAATAQQDKMKSCSADAKTKNLAGEERKTFMKSCLSAGSATTSTGSATAPEKHLTAQQEKMKTCSADAKTKGLKGDERKTFMSTCLKAK